MGRDQFENDELVTYAFPTDVWFHVDTVSSAHVYVRGAPSPIPDCVVDEACQLVKANSIKGSKKQSVTIVYTIASNLKKQA